MHKYKGFWINKTRRHGYIYYKVEGYKNLFTHLKYAKAYIDNLTVALMIKWASGEETVYRFATEQEARAFLISTVSERAFQVTDFTITK